MNWIANFASLPSRIGTTDMQIGMDLDNLCPEMDFSSDSVKNCSKVRGVVYIATTYLSSKY